MAGENRTDSIVLGIAAGGMYLFSLTALIGIDRSGGTTVAVAPTPMPGGAGLGVVGRF